MVERVEERIGEGKNDYSSYDRIRYSTNTFFIEPIVTTPDAAPKTGPKTRRTYTPAQKAIRRLGAGGAGGILCRDSVSPSRIKALLCTATFARSRRCTGPATTCRSSSVWRRYGDGSVSCKSWKGGIGENGKRRRRGRVKCDLDENGTSSSYISTVRSYCTVFIRTVQ